jgi:hypothetical protein
MVNKKYRFYILLAATSLLAGFFVFFPIADGDIFWHLASGREMLSNKHFLLTDPFSFTTPGIQWIDLHWLFQVLTYLIYSMSGYYGLLFFKSLIISGSVILLLSLNRTLSSMVVTAILFLFSFYQYRYLVPLRPGILTLFYLSLFIFLLERYNRTLRIRFLVLLIPLQILWVNTQGLFMIGPAVFVVYMLGGATDFIVRSQLSKNILAAMIKTRRNVQIIIIFLSLCIAGLITPYGFRGLLFPFRLFTQITPGEKNLYSNLIAENTPLLNMTGTDQEFYVVTFAILFFTALISIIISGKRTRSAHLYLFFCFSILAFMAQRNLILFIFAVMPLLQSNFEHFHLKTSLLFNRFLLYGLTMITVLYFTFVATLHFSMIQSVNNPVSPFCHPLESTEYLKNHNVNGVLFNADRYGGYCIWRLYPSHKVFIDTRLSMRERSFFSNYINILNSPEQFEQQIDNYGITAVLIPAHLPLYINLARYLIRNPQWAMVVCDGSEVLFVKRDQKPQNVIDLKNSTDLFALFERIKHNPEYKSPELINEGTARLKSFVVNMGLGIPTALNH